MLRSEYIQKIRLFLRDTKGKIFEDAELLSMLDKAARNYSADTGAYRGKFTFIVSSDRVCTLPGNYLGFLAGWNGDGRHVEPISCNELYRYYGNYSVVSGEPEFVYENIDSIGTFRLCPNPYIQQNLRIYQPYFPYGLVVCANYGIPLWCNDYGIPHKIYRYKNCGEAVYVRLEEAEKISDYMALIYNVLYQAYSVDSEFQNLSKAELYNTQYKKRIARFGQVKNNLATVRRRGKFF